MTKSSLAMEQYYCKLASRGTFSCSSSSKAWNPHAKNRPYFVKLEVVPDDAIVLDTHLKEELAVRKVDALLNQ